MTLKTTQFNAEPPLLPYREEQHIMIPLHSPAAIEGAFRYLLRERFKELEPWTWKENPTDTKIAIEVGDESQVVFADKKPSIWIGHGQTSYGSIVLGNRGPYQPDLFKKRLQHYYTIAQADMSISAVSPRRTESILLADLIQKFIHFSQGPICAAFKLHEITPPALNTTRPHEKDEKHYVTPVMFRISFELQWATIPAAAPLNNLKLKIEEKGAEAILHEFTMESTSLLDKNDS